MDRAETRHLFDPHPHRRQRLDGFWSWVDLRDRERLRKRLTGEILNRLQGKQMARPAANGTGGLDFADLHDLPPCAALPSQTDGPKRNRSDAMTRNARTSPRMAS
jgi:hypothetical protein